MRRTRARLLPHLLVPLLLATLAARPAAAGVNRWTPLGPGGGTILALAPDPGSPGTVYAGAEGSGVWKSLDGGAHWFAASAGLPPSSEVHALAVSPEDPRLSGPATVWAGVHDGIYKSVDGGATWQRVWTEENGTVHTWVLSLAADPRDPDVVWAGNVGGVVLKTEDGGESWTILNNVFGQVTSIVIDPDDPDTVYTGGESGIFRATEGGTLWTRLLGAPVTRLAIDPEDPRVLYAGSDSNGIFKSTDGGAGWIYLPGIDGAGAVQSLAVDPSDPRVVLAGFLANGVWRSTDAGATWERVQVPFAPLYPALAADPAEPGRIWLGSSSRGVFRSLDGGRTWSASREGLGASFIEDVAFDPFRPRTLYATADALGFHRSGNFGLTWTRGNRGLPDGAESGYGFQLNDIEPDPHHAGVLYAGLDLGLFRSRDRGQRWSLLLNSEGVVNSVAVHPRRRGLIFAVGEEVYRSQDDGRTWKHLFLPATDYEAHSARVVLDPRRPAHVFVLDRNSRRGRAESLFRSTDRGETWQRIFVEGPIDLVLHPRRPGVLYVATEVRGEIWRSDDNGTTWEKLAEGVGGDSLLTSLVIDPTHPSTLYVGSDGAGVWRSTDGGVTWSRLGPGMTAPRVTSLALDPRNPRRLIAGTWGGGGQEIRLTAD